MTFGILKLNSKFFFCGLAADQEFPVEAREHVRQVRVYHLRRSCKASRCLVDEVDRSDSPAFQPHILSVKEAIRQLMKVKMETILTCSSDMPSNGLRLGGS